MDNLRKTIQVNRGNECEDHLALKRMAGDFMVRCGFDTVLYEHLCCDVVGSKSIGSSRRTVGTEIERSSRNLLRNLNRDFAQGCDFVLIVCPTFQSIGEISRKLARELPLPLHPKVGIANPTMLQISE
jgi:hypothetical protein